MNPPKIKTGKENTIFEKINNRSNRIMSIALWIYFAVGILLAFYYDTFLLAFSIGALCLVAYYTTKSLLPKSNLYQYVLSVIFGIFSAQYIYQMHGMFEMHFMFLVGSALLITYQNWKLQLPLLVYIVLHHGSFAYLQYTGMKEIYFTQLEYMDLQTFLIHATVVTVIIFINGMWAFDLAKKTITESTALNAFEKQLQTVNQNIAFAEEISKGNLNKEHNSSADDELGKALLAMRDNLVLSAERERKEKYITQGSATIGEILRKYADNADQLANELVREIVKYTNSNQGSLFLLEKQEDTKEEYLQLAACYAYDRKKFVEKKIQIGESLVGQCFIERDLIFMTNVPQDYVKITSGLGLATPTCIVLLPLISNEEATGVLEIASFEKYDEAHIEFLKKAGEAIASAILNVKTTERVKYLLEESQQRSEELRTQEEEMRQNMEELSAVQEQLNRQLQEAERVQKALKEENEMLKTRLAKA